MNINRLQQRPNKVSSKDRHRKAADMPSCALHSPCLPALNPEVPKKIKGQGNPEGLTSI